MDNMSDLGSWASRASTGDGYETCFRCRTNRARKAWQCRSCTCGPQLLCLDCAEEPCPECHRPSREADMVSLPGLPATSSGRAQSVFEDDVPQVAPSPLVVETEGSLDERILRVLRNAKASLKPVDIARACGLQAASEVNRTLYRLRDEGEVMFWRQGNQPFWRIGDGRQTSSSSSSRPPVPPPSQHTSSSLDSERIAGLEAAIIDHLSNVDQPLTATEIARNCGHANARDVNPTLFRLERRGWLVREPGGGTRTLWRLA